MHNKTFTVDRTLSIVGGRNIGDHYYGMDRGYNFIDLDVLAAGPVVEDVSDGFDQFWNSSLSFPGSRLSRRVSEEAGRKFVADFRQALEAERADRLRDYPLTPRDGSGMLAGLPGGMHVGKAVFVQDRPEVEEDNRQLVNAIAALAARGKGEAIIVSPYFLPADASIENLRNATASGVRVKILTASLEANNQPLVDGHYRKLRRPLVNHGAELFELRPDPSSSIRADADIAPVVSQRVTLHAKTIVLDRRYSFIGSLNLDPRAMDINTESGMFIDSEPLARELAGWIDDLCSPENAWEVTRNAEGRIQWRSDSETRTSEPPAKWSRRLMSRISGILPIRDQL
jgi:putative cardiolipin synthase